MARLNSNKRSSRGAAALLLVAVAAALAMAAARPASSAAVSSYGFAVPAQPLNNTLPEWMGMWKSCVGCNITRTHVIERATQWVADAQPYCTCGSDCCGSCKYCSIGSPHYRCDCSGFVSWSWRLPGGLVTSTLPEVAHRIDKRHMKPGDVYLNDAVEGHVIIFNGWANEEMTAFHAMQEPGCHAPGLPPHACKNIETLPIWGVPHLFKPYRYNHIVDA